MPVHHVGRLIDHVHLRAKDLAASHRFYSAVFGVLGLPAPALTAHSFQADELYVSPVDPKEGIPPTHVHLAFQAADQAMVQAFHKAALAAGGTDNGGPGERSYHPGYYAAFAFDPDGNNIEAVFHGPSKRSAVDVEIEPIMP